MESGFSASSSHNRLEDAKSDEAKPEINRQPCVNVVRHVSCSGRQVRNEDEVNDVSRQNSNESLSEISHCGSRHRWASDQRERAGETQHLALGI